MCFLLYFTFQPTPVGSVSSSDVSVKHPHHARVSIRNSLFLNLPFQSYLMETSSNIIRSGYILYLSTRNSDVISLIM